MHGSLAEKIQQVKEENLHLYQQYTTAELKEKDLQKKREMTETNKTDDTRIRDRERSKKKNNRKKKKGKNKHDDKQDLIYSQKNTDHIVDIVV